MIHKKIEKLIPYISENFITYPLCEEGKYIPFVNIWQKMDGEEVTPFLSKVKQHFDGTGYSVVYTDTNDTETLHGFQIFPDWTEDNKGEYRFVNPQWSLEELLNVLIKALEK